MNSAWPGTLYMCGHGADNLRAWKLNGQGPATSGAGCGTTTFFGDDCEDLVLVLDTTGSSRRESQEVLV